MKYDHLKKRAWVAKFKCYFLQFSKIMKFQQMLLIAPDKDWKQLGIYPPLFGLIGYFKF